MRQYCCQQITFKQKIKVIACERNLGEAIEHTRNKIEKLTQMENQASN